MGQTWQSGRTGATAKKRFSLCAERAILIQMSERHREIPNHPYHTVSLCNECLLLTFGVYSRFVQPIEMMAVVKI